MLSERIQRRIAALLDEADEAVARLDWATVSARAAAALVADPENEDARAYLEMAQRGLAAAEDGATSIGANAVPATASAAPAAAQPESFAGGATACGGSWARAARSGCSSRTTSCSTARWRSR